MDQKSLTPLMAEVCRRAAAKRAVYANSSWTNKPVKLNKKTSSGGKTEIKSQLKENDGNASKIAPSNKRVCISKEICGVF